MRAQTKRFWLVAWSVAEDLRRLVRETAGTADRRRLGAVSFIAVLLMAGASGCSTSDKEVNAFLHEWETSVSATDYQVQPPDTIEISAAQAPEIDGEEQMVRSDGKVSLRLLGDVQVAGMTPVEISRKIEDMLREYYVDPKVNVLVTGRNSKRFFVFGQVNRAGAYNYTGRDSLLYVLSQAQPTFLAWKSQVKVIHPSHEIENRHVMTVDVDRIMEEGKLDQNVLLQDGDIVYVPATPLAWVGLRLQEVLWPVSPMVNAAQTPANVATAGQTAAVERTYRIPP